MSERTPGTRVRTYHGNFIGTIICQAESSMIDGGERVLVRWETDQGPKETCWGPDMLVPADTPRESDPERVLLYHYQGQDYYLTAKGIIKEPPDELSVEFLGNDMAVMSTRPKKG